MKGYVIEEIKHKEGDTMLTCAPPIMYPVLASIRYRTEDGIKWLHCMKIMEFYDFFESTEDLHEELLSLEDEKLMDDHRLSDFNGIPLDEIAANELTVEEAEERFGSNLAIELLKFAIDLADEWEEDRAKPLIEAAIGHGAGEINLE